MTISQDPSNKFEQLRFQAEKLIRDRAVTASDKPPEILELIHELRIYQTELEIQNDELKRAQRELSELHYECESLFEFAPCGYVTLDNKGIITRINLAGATLLGTSRKFTQFASFGLFISPGWETSYLAAREKSATRGEKQSIELSLKRDKGSSSWVRADIEADRDKSGAVVQWRMVLVDITPQKTAEVALLESEERFRTLFENAPVAYQSLDKQGNIIVVNETWRSMLKYSADQILGRHFAEFLDPDWRDHFKKILAQFQSAGEIYGTELVMRKADGTDIIVSFQGKNSRCVRGEITTIHCVFFDITAQRKIEEEKKRLEQQLIKSQKMEAIGTLAGGIAHDFNNLLMSIQGRTSLIAVDLDTDHPLQKHVEVIETTVQSAANLTKQLLGFARGGKYNVKPIDISELVASNAVMFGRTCKEIKIDTQTQPAPLVAECDRRQIEQVLLNILINAVQAMPNCGEINLDASATNLDQTVCRPHKIEPGPYVKISVTDTGIGMDENTRRRIFEPFFTTKEIGSGTGLGLASAYGIVKNHGGIITVDSEVGRGTTFDIYLPASDKPPFVQVSLREKLVKGSETILIVDDEAMVLDVAKSMLEKMGYHVFSAQSGEHALERVRRNGDEIDLVILDMIMPGMGGGETFNRIHKIAPAMPVLLSSGYTMNDQAKEIMQNGCNGFIEKPYDIAEFSKKIREILK